jgi:WD40 repeat protein
MDLLKLWEVSSAKCCATLEGHSGRVTGLAWLADGTTALSAGYDNTIRAWDLPALRCVHTQATGHDRITSIDLSADERIVITSGGDRSIRLWQVAGWKCLHTLEGHNNGVDAACLSKDASFILSGSRDCTIRLWQPDWEVEERPPADWDEGAGRYLRRFLDVCGRSGHLLADPVAFQALMEDLGYRGYGWLRPEGVRRKLEEMAQER